jgi:hypothetical protein
VSEQLDAILVESNLLSAAEGTHLNRGVVAFTIVVESGRLSQMVPSRTTGSMAECRRAGSTRDLRPREQS